MSESIKEPKKIHQIALDIFGDERVDFWESRNQFRLIVHFPEFTIRNESGHKNLIKDLYTKFEGQLTNSGRDNNLTFMGFRTTLSLKEHQSHYAHSHLPSGCNNNGWRNFCQGSSTFADIFNNVVIYGYEEMWEMMLMSLSRYVEWESLEGGPHIRMSNIRYTEGTQQRTQQVSQTALQTELRRLVHFVPKEVWEFAPNLRLIENHPELYSFFNRYSTIRKMTIGSGGLTPQTLREAESYRRNNANRIAFKGKEVPFKVYDETISDTDSVGNNIDKAVVDAFVTLLKTQSQTFSKKFHYESIKSARRAQLDLVSPF